MATEEVVALHLLVPHRLILLAPDSLPVRWHVCLHHVLRAHRRVWVVFLDEVAIRGALRVVVAGHEKLYDLVSVRREALRKHLVPDAGVEAHLLDLPAVREVAAVDNRVDVLIAEVP